MYTYAATLRVLYEIHPRFRVVRAIDRMPRAFRLAPFSGFDVSYASYVSILSVIVTYVIILLQFSAC